mgnify:CR=1 FL=1
MNFLVVAQICHYFINVSEFGAPFILDFFFAGRVVISLWHEVLLTFLAFNDGHELSAHIQIQIERSLINKFD